MLPEIILLIYSLTTLYSLPENAFSSYARSQMQHNAAVKAKREGGKRIFSITNIILSLRNCIISLKAYTLYVNARGDDYVSLIKIAL